MSKIQPQMCLKIKKNEVTTNQNEEPPEPNVWRSSRMRTESTRLDGYERSLDQAVNIDGDFIGISEDNSWVIINWLILIYE